MTFEIPAFDLKLILETLKTSENPDVKRAAKQIEGQDIREGLKLYDPPEEFRQHIRDVCDYLRARFNLDEWTGHIRFEDPGDSEDPASTIRASIKSNRTYLYYTIRIGPAILECWRDRQWREIGTDLCHEFTHVLTDPIVVLAMEDAAPSRTRMIEEVNERQTQRIAVVISTSLPDNWYTPEYLKSWRQRTS